VLQRADAQLGALLKRLFAGLLDDDSIAADAVRFRAFLETTFGLLFDYMVEHPRFARIINWEQASGWHTLAPIATQFEPADFERLSGILATAQSAGLLRSDLDVALAVLLVQQLCWSAPNSLGLYQLFLGGRGFSSAQALAHVRAQVIALSVSGVQPSPLSIQKG
jgi:TetR/AcrR family transcriptional regulator